jgi:hypothetical protein
MTQRKAKKRHVYIIVPEALNKFGPGTFTILYSLSEGDLLTVMNVATGDTFNMTPFCLQKMLLTEKWDITLRKP